MDKIAAANLADHLHEQRRPVCDQVAMRLLRTFPEIRHSLRLEENYDAESRLSEVAVERLNELVRAILLFDSLSVADSELHWASGVLPRSGVTDAHQTTMVRWFFEEVRRLPLERSELQVTHEVERHLLAQIRQSNRANCVAV